MIDILSPFRKKKAAPDVRQWTDDVVEMAIRLRAEAGIEPGAHAYGTLTLSEDIILSMRVDSTLPLPPPEDALDV